MSRKRPEREHAKESTPPTKLRRLKLTQPSAAVLALCKASRTDKPVPADIKWSFNGALKRGKLHIRRSAAAGGQALLPQELGGCAFEDRIARHDGISIVVVCKANGEYHEACMFM